MFSPLTSDQVYNIIDLQVNEIRKRLKDLNMYLDITPEAKEYILNHSYDVDYGARPVKRYLQTNVETKLARLIIEGKIGAKDTAILDVDKNKELAFTIK